MNNIQAIILGIVQGITEFFPVSSSGHLKLIEHFFGIESLDKLLTFDLICHGGTLCAILLVLHKDLIKIIKEDKESILHIFIALLPLLPLYFVMKPIKSVFSQPALLSYFFLITALILYIAEK